MTALHTGEILIESAYPYKSTIRLRLGIEMWWDTSQMALIEVTVVDFNIYLKVTTRLSEYHNVRCS